MANTACQSILLLSQLFNIGFLKTPIVKGKTK